MGQVGVALDQRLEFVELLGVEQGFGPDHFVVDSAAEGAFPVDHIGDASGHTGCKVAPGAAEHDHPAAGHVLAGMVADPFDHGGGAGVAHGKAFAGHPANVGFTGCGTVQRDVADDDVLFGAEGAARRRVDQQFAA